MSPSQRPQLLLVEDLGDEPGVAQGGDVAALAGGDPGRLLAAVLQRVEAEVGEAGDVVAGCVYAEDAALVTRPVAVIGAPRTESRRVFLADGGRKRRRTAYSRRLAATAGPRPCSIARPDPRPDVSAGWCTLPDARCSMPDRWADGSSHRAAPAQPATISIPWMRPAWPGTGLGARRSGLPARRHSISGVVQSWASSSAASAQPQEWRAGRLDELDRPRPAAPCGSSKPQRSNSSAKRGVAGRRRPRRGRARRTIRGGPSKAQSMTTIAAVLAQVGDGLGAGADHVEVGDGVLVEHPQRLDSAPSARR